MNLNYSDDQKMLRESAERYLQENYSFEQFRKLTCSETPLNRANWEAFSELGWLAMPFSEEQGGLGGGPIETALIAEQFGRHLVIEPFVAAVILAGGLVAELGTKEQQERLLKPLMEGRGSLALAHDEPGVRDSFSYIGATAERAGSGYIVNANKTAVVGGAWADTFLVSTKIIASTGEPQGTGIFTIPVNSPGLIVTPYRFADGSMAADVVLTDVRVDDGLLLGSSTDVTDHLDRAIDCAIAASCWDAVGVMDALIAATVEFTKQREQFGKPLSSFQALQHRMAEMSVKCVEARASAMLASLSLDAPATMRVRGVSGAKAKIGRISRAVAHEAIQLHGAMGFTDEVAVGWWFKRLFVFENLYGSTDTHLARYGALVKQPAVQAESLLREPVEQ